MYEKRVDVAITIGCLEFSLDGKCSVSFGKHRVIVYQILNNAARKSPTDIAQRFICQARNVFDCKRGSK